MLDSNDVKKFLEILAKDTRNEGVGSAIIVYGMKTIPNLFTLIGTLKGDTAIVGIAHGFGALITHFERVPPLELVNRPEHKKAITAIRNEIGALLDKFKDSLDEILNRNNDVYVDIISIIYEMVFKIESIALGFAAALPPMPQG